MVVTVGSRGDGGGGGGGRGGRIEKRAWEKGRRWKTFVGGGRRPVVCADRCAYAGVPYRSRCARRADRSAAGPVSLSPYCDELRAPPNRDVPAPTEHHHHHCTLHAHSRRTAWTEHGLAAHDYTARRPRPSARLREVEARSLRTDCRRDGRRNSSVVLSPVLSRDRVTPRVEGRRTVAVSTHRRRLQHHTV